jgi:hypothetical protein
MTVMMSVVVVVIIHMLIVAGCRFRRGMKIGLLVMVRFQDESKLCLRNDFGQSPFSIPTRYAGAIRTWCITPSLRAAGFEEDGNEALVSPTDHAWLAGRFAEHRGNERFVSPEPRDDVLEGIKTRVGEGCAGSRD